MQAGKALVARGIRQSRRTYAFPVAIKGGQHAVTPAAVFLEPLNQITHFFPDYENGFAESSTRTHF
ncbi:hypothetical protein GCM10027343_08700 [Noviherbaspirillum agri]